MSGSQPAGHSLGLPEASWCQLCQRSPQPTVSPAWCRGTSSPRAALPPAPQHSDPDGSWLELRATSCRDAGALCPLVFITNPLPPTAGLQTCIWQKNPTRVKRKMRENDERLFYFRMPIKDKVTSKSSSSAVIALMLKASQIWSKRLMLTKAGHLPDISSLPISI